MIWRPARLSWGQLMKGFEREFWLQAGRSRTGVCRQRGWGQSSKSPLCTGSNSEQIHPPLCATATGQGWRQEPPMLIAAWARYLQSCQPGASPGLVLCSPLPARAARAQCPAAGSSLLGRLHPPGRCAPARLAPSCTSSARGGVMLCQLKSAFRGFATPPAMKQLGEKHRFPGQAASWLEAQCWERWSHCALPVLSWAPLPVPACPCTSLPVPARPCPCAHRGRAAGAGTGADPRTPHLAGGPGDLLRLQTSPSLAPFPFPFPFSGG